MSRQIVIEPEAEADIARAHQWYEDQRPGLGDDFALCIEAALHVIRERPLSFPKVRKNARRILIKRFPYLMLFVEYPEFIIILGVFHSSRNPKVWKGRAR
jgi:plasmid stabilization system protein ParE